MLVRRDHAQRMTVANEKDAASLSTRRGEHAGSGPLGESADGSNSPWPATHAEPPSGARPQSGFVVRTEPVAAFESTQLIPLSIADERDAGIDERNDGADEDDQPTRLAPPVSEQHGAFGAPMSAPSTRGAQGPNSAPASSSAAVNPSLPSLSSLLDDESSFETTEEERGLPDRYVGAVLSDRYVIDRVLGEGGMGKVYRAHHKVIDKKVAVKILHAELAKDKESVGRFLREARAASSIGNPHIVDILDFGEADDGSTYFVMEYLAGESLGDMLAERSRLPATTTVDLSLQLCDGLAAAHGEGIVHRDLKPDNVILIKPKGTWAGQGHFVKILDFGIAKVSSHKGNTSKLTMAGAIFGTPHYMSPEQAAGEPVDHRTDIYSLGVMMYEMLVGDVPFKAENFMGILTQHMYKPPPSLRERTEDPTLPGALEAIILKCMSKRPETRYQSMEELAADLASFKATGTARATQESLPAIEATTALASPSLSGPPSSQLAPPSTGGRRTASLLTGALFAAAAVVGGVFVLRGSVGKSHAAPSAASTGPATVVATVTAAPTGPTAREGRGVLLFSDVPDAYATVDGKRVKLPETITVPAGSSLTVTVDAGADYASTSLVVDGATPKVKVELTRKAGVAATASASAASVPTMPFGGRPYAPPPGTSGLRPGSIPPKNPKGVVEPW